MSGTPQNGSVDLHRIITDKQVRSVMRSLIDDGWTFVRLTSANHPMLRWEGEDGSASTITMPLTPSDRRAMRNAMADARRISGIDHGRSGEPSPAGPLAVGQSRQEPISGKVAEQPARPAERAAGKDPDTAKHKKKKKTGRRRSRKPRR